MPCSVVQRRKRVGLRAAAAAPAGAEAFVHVVRHEEESAVARAVRLKSLPSRQ